MNTATQQLTIETVDEIARGILTTRVLNVSTNGERPTTVVHTHYGNSWDIHYLGVHYDNADPIDPKMKPLLDAIHRFAINN